MIFLKLVAVIGDRTVIDGADTGNQMTPFHIAVIGSDHFTAGAEQICMVFLSHGSDAADMILPGSKPVLPAGFRGNGGVKEPYIGPPVAVAAVDHRLENHLQPQGPGMFAYAADVIGVHDIGADRGHGGGIGVILPGTDREYQGVAVCGPDHFFHGPFPGLPVCESLLFAEAICITVDKRNRQVCVHECKRLRSIA